MYFKDFIDELLDRLGLKTNDEYRTSAGRKINLALNEVANVTNVVWEPLKVYGEIRTIANITDGTCEITKGSRTVAFSGVTIPVGVEGRFFKSSAGGGWYQIVKRVSANEVTLRTAIIEDSASGLTHTIWNRFYYFPSEVRRILEFGSWINDGRVEETFMGALRADAVDISVTGQPMEFVMYGSYPFEKTYSTGTVTISKNGATLIGIGTAWLANVEPGDRVTIGANSYRVKRVESDTSIILHNHAKTDVVAAATYTITKDNNLGFQLWYNPGSELILPYTAVRRVYDMVNEEYDETTLPPEFNMAILDNAEFNRMKDLKDQGWQNVFQMFRGRIADLKATRFVSNPKKGRPMNPNIPSRGGYL